MSGLELGMGDYMQVGPAARFVGPNAAQVIMRGPHGMRLAADPVKTREGRVRGSGFRFWAEQELPFLEKHQSWNPGARVVGLMGLSGLGLIKGPGYRYTDSNDWKKKTNEAIGLLARLTYEPNSGRVPISSAVLSGLNVQISAIDRVLKKDESNTRISEAEIGQADRARQNAINILNKYRSDTRSFTGPVSDSINAVIGHFNNVANYLLDVQHARRYDRKDEFSDLRAQAAMRDREQSSQPQVDRDTRETSLDSIRAQVAMREAERKGSSSSSTNRSQPAKATDPWWRSSAKEKAREGGRTTLGTDELKISLNTGGSGSGLSTPVMVGVAVVGTLGALAALKVLIGVRS